jgi:hypothetical protein
MALSNLIVFSEPEDYGLPARPLRCNGVRLEETAS